MTSLLSKYARNISFLFLSCTVINHKTSCKLKPINFMTFYWFYFNDIENNPALNISKINQLTNKNIKIKQSNQINNNLLKRVTKVEKLYNKPLSIYEKVTHLQNKKPDKHPIPTKLEIQASNHCAKCKEYYNEEDYSIEMMFCDLCMRWSHRNCEGITSREYRQQNPKKLYVCVQCKKWISTFDLNCKTIFEATNKKNIDLAREKVVNKDSRHYGKRDEEKPFKVSRSLKISHPVDDCNILVENKKVNEVCHGQPSTSNLPQTKGSCKTCATCHKIGATITCIICRSVYFHIYCYNELLVSDLKVPTCNAHKITYSYPYVGMNVGLVYKNYVYFQKDWYGVIIDGNFIERRDDYLFLNNELVQVSVLCKYFSKSLDINNLSLNQLFDLDGTGFTLFLKYIKNRPNILSDDEFNKNMLEMISFLQEDLPIINTTVRCPSLDIIKNNKTPTHLNHCLRDVGYRFSKSSIEGHGLFSNRLYDKDEPIVAYTGEIIDNDEANRREVKYGERIYMFRQNSRTILDATILGNFARYINHSCEPNCYATKVVCGTWTGVIVCANRIIVKGEELFYNYNLSKGIRPFDCKCGSKKCVKLLSSNI